MRSSSSASRALAVLLSTLLSVTGGAVPWAHGEMAPEPCLLLKVASRGIPASAAREALASISKSLENRLAIRWVPPGDGEAERRQPDADPYPEATPRLLGEVSRLLEEANRRMEEMETADARRLLREAEERSREARFGPVIRPYLAEIFFRQGILFLWNGEEEGCRERFARSRAMRPDFSPEPALYSPAVREAWERSRDLPVSTAAVLVRSIPPGAAIHLDGQPIGVTPGRISIAQAGPVRIRVEREGFRAKEKITQWIPGDSGMVDFTLERDPLSDLPRSLDADPEGDATGRLLAEMGRQAGALRVAVLAYDTREEQVGVLRVLSLNSGDPRAVLLGALPWPAGKDSAERVAQQAASLLAKAGWPVKTTVMKRSRPWYHTWWFWTVMVTVVAGVAAAGAGGGGGNSGSSTGTIGVTF